MDKQYEKQRYFCKDNLILPEIRLFAMVNVNWPTAVAGEADNVSSLPASACHIDGPNSVNPGQVLLVYGRE